MMKKFLISAAAVAALTTSAVAYDIYPTNQLKELQQNVSNVINVGPTALSSGTDTNNTGLIFPAYFAGSGWETSIKIINTKSYPVVAKVVLYGNKDSKEVKDFNIYLSGNDVFTATIKVDSDGKTKIISTDDSAPLPIVNNEVKMASADNPMSEEINTPIGYIQVIPMVMFTYETHDHAALRNAYIKFSNLARTGSENPNLVFSDGVVKNKVTAFPYVDINKSVTSNAFDVTGDTKADGNFTTYFVKTDGTHSINGALDGYIRITDTVNGKDMIQRPQYVSFQTTYGNDNNSTALIYLEGEKATLADVTLDVNSSGDNVYNLGDLNTSVNLFTVNSVYLTYGEAAPNAMQALFTSPFKRVIVQESLYENNDTAVKYWFDGYKLNSDKTDVESYGYYKLVAQIYDNSENLASASQFSPATTPTITMYNELASTGTNTDDTNSLAHYIVQAGYKEGFVKLTNAKSNGGTPNPIPAIVTQMIATTAAGKTITNWINPITR